MEILLFLATPMSLTRGVIPACLRTHISARGDIYVSTYARSRRVGEARQGERSWRSERCRQRDEGKKKNGVEGRAPYAQPPWDQCTFRVHRPGECSRASSMHLRMQPEPCFILINPFSSASRHDSLSLLARCFCSALHVRVVPFSFSRPSHPPFFLSLSLSLSLSLFPSACRRSSTSPLSHPPQRHTARLPFYSPPFTCVFHLAPTSHPSDSLSFTLCSSPALDSLSS